MLEHLIRWHTIQCYKLQVTAGPVFQNSNHGNVPLLFGTTIDTLHHEIRGGIGAIGSLSNIFDSAAQVVGLLDLRLGSLDYESRPTGL